MAGKDAPIVIKKITIVAGGAHGGAWKVAFADFMTAMMCFFLVMWLLNQTEEVKKEVASYFSGPSMIEQQMTSYGAELTLEKLFLDLVNEPLKALQTFMQPADFTPNLMAMGSKKIVLHHIAEELGPVAENVQVESNQVTFEIPDYVLFRKGTAEPSAKFVETLEKIRVLTTGLEESNVVILSKIYQDSVGSGTRAEALQVAESRLDLLRARIKGTLEHPTVDVMGSIKVMATPAGMADGKATGMIRITLEQKEVASDGRTPRPLEDAFGAGKSDMTIYDDFVNRVGEEKPSTGRRERARRRDSGAKTRSE